MSEDGPSATSAAFNSQTSPEMSSLGSEKRIEAAQVESRAYDIGVKVEEHYKKHREDWVQAEYGKLKAKDHPKPELKPDWAPPRDVMRDASNNVARRHAVRQARVILAKRNMIREIGRSDGAER